MLLVLIEAGTPLTGLARAVGVMRGAVAHGPCDSGSRCIALILRFHGLAAEASALVHRFAPGPEGHTDSDLLRASRESGLKARTVSVGPDSVSKVPMPAITKTKSGAYFALAKIEIGDAPSRAVAKVLIHRPIADRPFLMICDALDQIWTNKLFLMTKRVALSEAFTNFDIAWYISAILKYKRILIEVLVAPFVLQLFALVIPLFFQVTIDKVLVHHGLTTLSMPISYFYAEMSDEVSEQSPAKLMDVPLSQLPLTDEVELDPMTRRETLELMRAYSRIKCPETRKYLAKMVKSIAKGGLVSV